MAKLRANLAGAGKLDAISGLNAILELELLEICPHGSSSIQITDPGRISAAT